MAVTAFEIKYPKAEFINKLDILVPSTSWVKTTNGYTYDIAEWLNEAFITPIAIPDFADKYIISFDVKFGKDIKKDKREVYSFYSVKFAEFLITNFYTNFGYLNIDSDYSF